MNENQRIAELARFLKQSEKTKVLVKTVSGKEVTLDNGALFAPVLANTGCLVTEDFILNGTGIEFIGRVKDGSKRKNKGTGDSDK